MVTLSTFGRQVEQTPEMASARLSDIRQRVTDLEKVVIENERKGNERGGGFQGFGRSTFSRTAPPRKVASPNLVTPATTVVTAPLVAAAGVVGLAGVARGLISSIIKNSEFIAATKDIVLEQFGLDPKKDKNTISALTAGLDFALDAIKEVKAAQQAIRQTLEQTFSGIKAQVTLGGKDADFSDIGTFIENIYTINQARNKLEASIREAALKELVKNSTIIAKGLIP